MSPIPENLLADHLVARGVPRERLDALLARRARAGDRRPLEALLLEAGLVDPALLGSAREDALAGVAPALAASRSGSGRGRTPIVPVESSTPGNDSWDVEGLPSSVMGRVPGPEELQEGQLLTPRPGLDLAVRQLLGRGGMGVVHLVVDTRLHRLAALKLVKGSGAGQSRAARFLREVAVTAQLDHPGIPPVYEAGVLPTGQSYLLMRYLPGQSLQARLRELHARERDAGPVPLAELRPLLSLLVRVCEAVAYAHSRGIVHRDLKPANIVLGTFGEVCVVDWGLARDVRESASADAALRKSLVDPFSKPLAGPEGGALKSAATSAPLGTSDQPDLTVDGAVLGTVGFMAPEQARQEDVDARADVFSLGAILSCLLTGEAPFAGGAPVAMLAQATLDEVLLPSERRSLPRELASIAARALAPARDDRYPTAEGLAHDLQAWLEGRPVRAHRYGPVEQAARLVRARPVLAAGLAVGAVVAGIGVGAAAAARDRASRTAREEAVAAARDAALAVAPVGSAAPTTAGGSADALREARLRQASGRIARALAGLSAAQRWHALAPADPAAARRRFEAALALGDVAEEAEQWPLALEAFGEAAALGVDDARAAARRDAVAAAADAEPRRRADALRAVLERARAGALEAPGAFDDALFALCRHPEPAAVDVLVDHLGPLTAALQDAELEVWAGVEAPTPEEAQEGGRRLTGLAEAVRRDLARPDGVAPSPTDEALFVAGWSRLWRRLTRRAGVAVESSGAEREAPVSPRDLVRGHLAARQRDALGLPALRTASLIGAALGRLGLRGAVPPLVTHLKATEDPERALPLAVALCRLGGVDAVRAVRGAAARLGPRLDVPVHEALRQARLDDVSTAGASDRERGSLLAEVGRFEEALRALDAALDASPDDPDALRQRAAIRLRLGDRDGALQDAGRAVTLAGTPQNLFVLGNVRRERGELREAEEAYTQALRLSPDAVELLMNRGATRDLANAVEAAEADFRRARELDPLLAVAWMNEANCQVRRGAQAQALTSANRAIELGPGVARAWAIRASARDGMKDLAGALADLTEAVRLDPTDARTWSNLGWARFRAGQVEQAVQDYSRAIQLDDGQAGFFHNRGQGLRRLDRREDALRDLGRAIALEPRRAEWWVARAVVLFELGRQTDGLADLGKALEVDPRHAIARYNRAITLKMRRDYAGARADLEELARVAPSFDQLWFELGLVRLIQDDARGAAEALVRAQAARPDDAVSWIVGGLAHEASGEHDAALAALARGAATRWEGALWLATLGGSTAPLVRVARPEPGAQTGIEVPIARWLLGELDERGLLEAAESGPPERQREQLRRVYLHLGVVAARAGRMDAARLQLERSLELDQGAEPVETAFARSRLRLLSR